MQGVVLRHSPSVYKLNFVRNFYSNKLLIVILSIIFACVFATIFLRFPPYFNANFALEVRPVDAAIGQHQMYQRRVDAWLITLNLTTGPCVTKGSARQFLTEFPPCPPVSETAQFRTVNIIAYFFSKHELFDPKKRWYRTTYVSYSKR